MQKKCYENEAIKKEYFEHLKEVKGFSPNSIKVFEQSILLWQEFSDNKDFKTFGKKDVTEFKVWLRKKENKRTKESLSLSYLYHLLRRLRVFFQWLVSQPNYKHINPTFIDYLSLSKKEARIAIQSKKMDTPSMEDVIKVIENIEIRNEVDKRDRALICFTLLTGARISAIASISMQCFDRENYVVDQNPKLGVKTKFSKQITTTLFPLNYDKALEYFLEWYDYLREVKGFKGDNPLFPMTEIINGKENTSYRSTGDVIPSFWSSASGARKVFEKRFIDAGIPYYHPHTFRHLVVKEFLKTRLTEQEKKAISQNLGHENIGTTFGSYGYGHIEDEKQIEIVKHIRIGGKDIEGTYSLSSEEMRFIDALRQTKH